MTYIQDKLDEIKEKTKHLDGLVDKPLLMILVKEALTDYHNHILEKIEKLSKNAEEFVPFQKIHYQSALKDLKFLLQDTNLTNS